jgi:hypothetical protein
VVEIRIADPAVIDERLAALAERIWQVKGVIGALRDAVRRRTVSPHDDARVLAHPPPVELTLSESRRHWRLFFCHQPDPIRPSSGHVEVLQSRSRHRSFSVGAFIPRGR